MGVRRSRLQGFRGVRPLKSGELLWRVGYFETPLECPPHAYWFGDGRYDDPLREFQTLYCAPDPLTCLRETLAPFRVSIRMRDELQRQGKPLSKGGVPAKWRRENALAQGRLEILEGELIPMHQPGIRSRLEKDLKALLIDLEISFLDLGELQGNRRKLTQAIARTVFGWGAAGILYQSKL